VVSVVIWRLSLDRSISRYLYSPGKGHRSQYRNPDRVPSRGRAEPQVSPGRPTVSGQGVPEGQGVAPAASQRSSHRKDHGTRSGAWFDRDDLLFELRAPAAPRRQVPEALPVPATLGLTEPNQAGRRYQHGTLSGYNAGRCRCRRCKDACAHYRARRRSAGKDSPRIPRSVDTDATSARTGSAATSGSRLSNPPVAEWLATRIASRPSICRVATSYDLPDIPDPRRDGVVLQPES
jgi:hypothetical protein